MASLDSYTDEQLSRGLAWFSKREAIAALDLKSSTFLAAAGRLIRKGRLVMPRQGFYLILRPEDRALGAPDPSAWIDPLMRHLNLEYRVSLLRAAALHGASHQSSMVFQVVVAKQLREIRIGRQRILFVFMEPSTFAVTNLIEWLTQLRSPYGFAKAAGVELTLLDSARYLKQSGGLSNVAQVVKDIGGDAGPRILARAAREFENSSVRRLGYLLERSGHRRQADALAPVAAAAKSFKALNPSVRAYPPRISHETRNTKWMLAINDSIEIDD